MSETLNFLALALPVISKDRDYRTVTKLAVINCISCWLLDIVNICVVPQSFELRRVKIHVQ